MVQFTRACVITGAISVLASFSLVSAATICTYTSRSCIGNYGCCSNIGANVCCTYPANYGWSTLFTGMPSGWYGYTYGDTCSTITGGAGSSSGQACISVYNGPTYLNARSSKWRLTSARRSEDEIRRDAADCAVVDTFGFTGKDGKGHEVRIPAGKTFGDLEELAKAGRFDELLKLASN